MVAPAGCWPSTPLYYQGGSARLQAKTKGKCACRRGEGEERMDGALGKCDGICAGPAWEKKSVD